jgi:hypothetical protein
MCLWRVSSNASPRKALAFAKTDRDLPHTAYLSVRFMAKRYTVYVDENFHYMDESERYKHGEFDDCQSAVAACKRIVDEFLSTCDVSAGAEGMYKQYTNFGEDPWIGSDDSHCKFSAWDYAKKRCRELVDKKGG